MLGGGPKLAALLFVGGSVLVPGGRAQHDCLSCLEPPCSATVCAAATNALCAGNVSCSYIASRLNAPHSDGRARIPLYLGGLFPTRPDVAGGLEYYHHFNLAVQMLNDKTDGQ